VAHQEAATMATPSIETPAMVSLVAGAAPPVADPAAGSADACGFKRPAHPQSARRQANRYPAGPGDSQRARTLLRRRHTA
jgi:hypothetical protein